MRHSSSDDQYPFYCERKESGIHSNFVFDVECTFLSIKILFADVVYDG